MSIHAEVRESFPSKVPPPSLLPTKLAFTRTRLHFCCIGSENGSVVFDEWLDEERIFQVLSTTVCEQIHSLAKAAHGARMMTDTPPFPKTRLLRSCEDQQSTCNVTR